MESLCLLAWCPQPSTGLDVVSALKWDTTRCGCGVWCSPLEEVCKTIVTAFLDSCSTLWTVLGGIDLLTMYLCEWSVVHEESGIPLWVSLLNAPIFPSITYIMFLTLYLHLHSLHTRYIVMLRYVHPISRWLRMIWDMYILMYFGHCMSDH